MVKASLLCTKHTSCIAMTRSPTALCENDSPPKAEVDEIFSKMHRVSSNSPG